MNGTVRLIAAIEAAKGMLALVAASGMLSLLHHDLRAIAYALVEHAHLNPAARYPAIFVRAAEHLQDANLQLVAAGAAAYALLRLVEAWGLWRGRGWAELLAAASGAIYLPFEAFGLLRHSDLLHAALLLLNVLVVAVMMQSWSRRRARARNDATTTG